MTPTGAELLRQVMDSRLLDVHVAMPGRVESYDATAQTANVQPMVKNVIRDEKGELVESYPLLTGIPVAYPRCAKFFVAFPLVKGDFVTVLFNEWSLDHFLNKGSEVHPVDLARHAWKGAIAIPIGPYPQSSPIGETLDGLVVGRDGGAVVRIKDDGSISAVPSGAGLVNIGAASGAEFVAQATKTLDRLQAIVTGFNSHVHPTGTGPSGVPAVLLSTPVVAVAATKAKVT